MTTIDSRTPPDSLDPTPNLLRTRPSDHAVRKLFRNPLGVVSVSWMVVLAVLALAAPLLPLANPQATDLNAVAVAPSWQHILGTDSVGRDILSRLIFGGQVTLLSAALASTTAIAIGVPLGLISGYYLGRLDGFSSWWANLLMSLPSIVVLLALRAAFGPSVWISMIAFGVLLAPSFFRLARTATMGVRQELYVDAARVSGLGDSRIIARHIFSVVRAPIIIQAAMVGGMAISIQSGLDFLGLGDPSQATWGIMLSEAFARIYQYPGLLAAPGIAISGTIAALALFANALRDALEDRPNAGTRRSKTGVEEQRRTWHARTSGDPVLEVSELMVGYSTKDGSTKHVVRGVDFRVEPGEILGIVGESGSGKTQTALSILGLLPEGGRIDGGNIKLYSSKTNPKNASGTVGYVPQEPMTNLDPSFTVGYQLTRPLVRIQGMSQKDAMKRAESLLSAVGIKDVGRILESYPHEISGGMAQRVLIAGAISSEPSLLIADEPTTALDVTVQAEVLDVLRTLREETGTAILLITHNFGVVADLCDRVAVMQHGQIVEMGDVRQVLQTPQTAYAQTLMAASLVGRTRGKK